MAKTYDNNMRGVLFKNEEKKSDKHPDYRGSAQIGGVDYFMDAWINEAQSGRKYMSFTFKKKELPQESQVVAPRQSTRQQKDDDDCPF